MLAISQNTKGWEHRALIKFNIVTSSFYSFFLNKFLVDLSRRTILYFTLSSYSYLQVEGN